MDADAEADVTADAYARVTRVGLPELSFRWAKNWAKAIKV